MSNGQITLNPTKPEVQIIMPSDAIMEKMLIIIGSKKAGFVKLSIPKKNDYLWRMEFLDETFAGQALIFLTEF